MRTDLVVGVIVSAAIHGSILLGTPRTRSPEIVAPAEPETVVQIEMPPIPPEETEAPVEELKAEESSQLAPPMLPDVPSPQLSVFTTPMQPPPPPGIPTSNLSSIPVSRNVSVGGGRMPSFFDPKDLEQQPSLASPIPPVYPFEMRRAGIVGHVTVEFLVMANGRTSNASVVSSTHREFEKAALDAVAKWQFRPGKKSGRAVNTRVQQLIDFNLNDS